MSQPPADHSASDSTADLKPLPAGVPRRIGHYTIQSVIASGGMGTVYKAVQENPRRVVAIKVMKAGVTSGSALRRFEYESQLLGRLRHPGIAQVFEAGTHGEGEAAVPYFAMEYIPNARSITAFAKEKKLGTRQCLDLFAKVCDAVHHGHQKGIVHRDLKPTNILVGPNGNSRIIDFGVARATDSDMALTMMQTDVGQLVGTLQYMSPEQCEADPLDLDTRSDVYALGVVLYELLCGRLPYDFGKSPIFEATRIVREQDPTSPSTLNPKLRGDVETIVLKAMEKDRDRRYQSTAELAQDMRRYLAGDAISARPASLGYQLRVFARRNKVVLTAAATIFVVVVAGAVVSTALYFRSETNRLLAEQEQQKAADAAAYLQELVASVDPTAYGGQVEVAKLLDSYGAKIEDQFGENSEVEATVRSALAQSYIYLNLIERGERSEASWQAAENHLNAALEIRREALGDNHPDTLETIGQIAFFLSFGRDVERAELLRREAYATAQAEWGVEDQKTLDAGYDLAKLLIEREKFDEAQRLLAQFYEASSRLRGDEHTGTLTVGYQLSRALLGQRKLEEAEQLSRQVYESRLRVSGEDSRSTINARGMLASALIARAKIDEARALFDRSIDPEALGVERWLDESATVPGDQPTVVVFWEPWCPFSQVFVPPVDELASDYGEDAVRVLGFTSFSKETTEAEARDFIARNELSFPSAKCDGELQSSLGFTGVPNAVAMQDGQVIWAGHPSQLSRTFFDGLTGRRTN